MKHLLTITQKDVEPNFIGNEPKKYFERHAARAVLHDRNKKVALLFATNRGYYKLPGGGIEEGEAVSAALTREIAEEVGANINIESEIGRIEEWRIFEDGSGMHQISDAFLARVIGDVGKPDFTESEIAEGFAVIWVESIEEAIKRVNASLGSSDPRERSMSIRDSKILHEVVRQIL